MTNIQLAAVLLGLFALQACAPTLTPEGEQVRTVSKEFGEGCEKLGRVEGVADGRTSFDLARNKAAALGGDSIVIQVKNRPMYRPAIFTGFFQRHSRRGELHYVTRAEALKCER